MVKPRVKVNKSTWLDDVDAYARAEERGRRGRSDDACDYDGQCTLNL